MKLESNRIGLTLGSLSAVWHAAWILVVGSGRGPQFLSWIFSMHFIGDGYGVTQFQGSTAILGIVMAFISGYIFGWLFAVLWNWWGKYAH